MHYAIESKIQRRFTVMAIETVREFLESVKQDQQLKEKVKAAQEPETLVEIAKERSYIFSPEELDTALSNLSKKQDELAALVNPGISPRRHLHPR
jgi:predicted ribosomally synthesized peptide with nif11-like leader